MNSFIDYTGRAQTIRGILELRAPTKSTQRYMEAEQSRLLDRVERGIADQLWRVGMSRDAAQQSSFEFVRQVVEHHRITAANETSEVCCGP